MIQFVYHPQLEKEIQKKSRKFQTIESSYKAFEKLCEFHFDPVNPSQRIAPAKLHRVTQNELWVLWKVELVLIKSGLRPNQFPRVWFAVQGATIVFLCMNDHIDNYDDFEMDKLASSRASEML